MVAKIAVVIYLICKATVMGCSVAVDILLHIWKVLHFNLSHGNFCVCVFFFSSSGQWFSSQTDTTVVGLHVLHCTVKIIVNKFNYY
jgi:hypothetical protein